MGSVPPHGRHAKRTCGATGKEGRWASHPRSPFLQKIGRRGGSPQPAAIGHLADPARLHVWVSEPQRAPGEWARMHVAACRPSAHAARGTHDERPGGWRLIRRDLAQPRRAPAIRLPANHRSGCRATHRVLHSTTPAGRPREVSSDASVLMKEQRGDHHTPAPPQRAEKTSPRPTEHASRPTVART